MELFLISFILILIYIYQTGVNKNKQIIRDFFLQNFDLLKDNFYHIGLNFQNIDELEESIFDMVNNENIVEQDSANFYRIFFSGRQNIKYCIMSIGTKRR